MFLKGLDSSLIQQKFLVFLPEARIVSVVCCVCVCAEMEVARAGHGIDGKSDSSSE